MNANEQIQAILSAARFAAEKHAGQRRKGDAAEPYVNHLIEVAELVAMALPEPDTNLVIAALLLLIGGVVLLQFLAMRASRSPAADDLLTLSKQSGWVGPRVFFPASVLIAVSGVGLGHWVRELFGERAVRPPEEDRTTTLYDLSVPDDEKAATGATVANLDEDPDTPDAAWATATTVADTSLRTGFPTPAGSPTLAVARRAERIGPPTRRRRRRVRPGRG